MNITYTEEKRFTQDEVQALFRSVDWESAEFPSRLYKALMHSPTVLTAWDGDRLVGLARVLDDSELVAFLHYVLVDPAYQGQGIATALINRLKEKYRNYLYFEVMPDERQNAAFYERLGFRILPECRKARRCRSRISPINAEAGGYPLCGAEPLGQRCALI